MTDYRLTVKDLEAQLTAMTAERNQLLTDEDRLRGALLDIHRTWCQGNSADDTARSMAFIAQQACNGFPEQYVELRERYRREVTRNSRLASVIYERLGLIPVSQPDGSVELVDPAALERVEEQR